MARAVNHRRRYGLLTAAFTAATVAVTSIMPAGASAPHAANDNEHTETLPPAPDPLAPRACMDDITPQNVKERTGFSNYEALRQASALMTQMNGKNGTTAAVMAILEASEATGVDFELMIAKAILESRLGVHSKPLGVNGSARGVYQYMPATWLVVFSRYGDEYKNGQYKNLADQIRFRRNGEPYVANDAVEKQILEMRLDPFIAAFIKARQMQDEEAPLLRGLLNDEPKAVDYYMLHFLGYPRTQLFYKKLDSTPNAIARNTFRAEAKYNYYVFYNSAGNPRTYQQVYNHLKRLMGNYIELVHDTVKTGEQYGCIMPLQRGQEPPPEVPAIPLPTPRPDPAEVRREQEEKRRRIMEEDGLIETPSGETVNIPVPTPRPQP